MKLTIKEAGNLLDKSIQEAKKEYDLLISSTPQATKLLWKDWLNSLKKIKKAVNQLKKASKRNKKFIFNFSSFKKTINNLEKNQKNIENFLLKN